MKYPCIQKVKILRDYHKTILQTVKHEELNVKTYKALTEYFGKPEQIVSRFQELESSGEIIKYEKERKLWIVFAFLITVGITMTFLLIFQMKNEQKISVDPKAEKSVIVIEDASCLT